MLMTEIVRKDSLSRKKTHELPIDIILFHMVDFGRIKYLPANAECTEILQSAALRALAQMYPDANVTVEAFIPRYKEFQHLFEVELIHYHKGSWKAFTQQEIRRRLSGQNDNISASH